MDLSMRWLKDYVDIGEVSMRDFSEAMSMSGSKVEGWKTEFDEVKNVVVGKILSVEKHPDSDHLVICQLDVGQEEPVQIVTGAPNVKERDKVPVVLDGGKAAEQGTPQELYEKGGVYTRMVKLQSESQNWALE